MMILSLFCVKVYLMSKKVGVLNFQHSEQNYGALLQAVALQDYIKSLGYDVETIDFRPEPQKNIMQKIRFNVGLFIRLLRLNKIMGLSDYIGNKGAFENFRLHHLQRTKQSYTKFDELKKISSKYQAIVVGSDQVWRPKYTWNRPLEFFLSFVENDCKRISYAASFGVDNWEYDQQLTDKIKQELEKFISISVRESSGVTICKETFNVDATHVLDPTLLCGQQYFNNLINNKYSEKEEDTLVYYILDSSDEIKQSLTKFSKKLGLSATNIFYEQGVIYQKYSEVLIWLNKLRNSKFIVTDSFHCVCFAIIFNKPFVCYANSDRGIARLESLLSKLNLSERIIFKIDDLENEKYSNYIDYKKVNNILSKERIVSQRFIKDSLDKI